MASELPERLFLYDGVCGLCERLVQWILAHDSRGIFRFAPLQGETAERLRSEHPEIPRGLDTAVYFEHGRVHLRSRAVFLAARELGYPWRLLSWLRVLPRPLTDIGYRFIARIRYRVFGKHDVCRIPSPEERERFLP